MPGTASGDETGTGGTPDLTDFQLEVARPFFSLPASKGFLLTASQLGQPEPAAILATPGINTVIVAAVARVLEH